MVNLSAIADEVRQIVGKEEKILSALPEDVVSGRFNKQNRNIKMLLGHMIDSAGDNQLRLVYAGRKRRNAGVPGLHPGQ